LAVDESVDDRPMHRLQTNSPNCQQLRPDKPPLLCSRHSVKCRRNDISPLCSRTANIATIDVTSVRSFWRIISRPHSDALPLYITISGAVRR